MKQQALKTQRDQAVELLTRHGVMRQSDLTARGVHHETLARLTEGGVLLRVSRGLYQLADADIDAAHSLAEVAKRVPKGVVCLTSALQYYELTVQTPRRIWLAIGYKDREPKVEYPPIRIVRFSSKALELGVETHRIDGVDVKIFSPAKTVADCFRLRGRIGLNVAIEGLQNAINMRKAKPDDIVRFAKETRIWSVLRPYLETVLADEA